MNDDLTREERKEWARLLYTKDDKSIKEVAAIVSADQSTVRKWVQDGSWDAVKRSLLIAKSTQLDHLYAIVESLTAKMKHEESITAKDVDLVMKYTAAIKNLETDTSVSHIIEVAELFISWLHTRDLALTKKVTQQFDVFIKERLG